MNGRDRSPRSPDPHGTAVASPATSEHQREPQPSWWRRYVFSTDHKVIGIQYMITSLLVALFGFGLMAVMRWQLSFPGKPVPGIGPLLLRVFGPNMAPGGAMSPDLYNSFGAMHGTMMIFMAMVPALFSGFGNFIVPLQLGAPDMAFPRLNMASYWAFLVGVLVMLASFFVPAHVW